MSGGERQRLAIARVILADTRVVILDEATSSIDSYTENILQTALRKISEGRTTIVIAHRMSTIINSDKIILLEDGIVVEQGNHEQLMRNNGKYRRMYDTQLSIND